MPVGAVPFPFGRCRICKDRATGLHYGVATCEGCKGFFKRSIGKSHTFHCLNGHCDLSPTNRSRCKACRFKRCLVSGMSVEAVRMGRIPNTEKEKVMEAFKRGGSDIDGHELVVRQGNNGVFSFELNQTGDGQTGNEQSSLGSFAENQQFCQQAGLYPSPSDAALRWLYHNQCRLPRVSTVYSEPPRRVKHPVDNLETSETMKATGFGQIQQYPWDQQSVTGLQNAANHTELVFNNFPVNKSQQFRYIAPDNNESSSFPCSGMRVQLNEAQTRTPYLAQQPPKAYGSHINFDMLNDNAQMQTHTDDISQAPAQPPGDLALISNHQFSEKTSDSFPSVSLFPDAMVSHHKTHISDESWVSAANLGHRTLDNMDQSFSRSQSRSPYSRGMIQLLIDQVVETNKSEEVIQEIKKVTDHIKDQDIVENIVHKLEKATRKRKYLCSQTNISSNTNSYTGENKMDMQTGYNSSASTLCLNSPETDMTGISASSPLDDCASPVATADDTYKLFSEIVASHGDDMAKVFATIGEIRLGMAIQNRDKADHRRKIQLHHAGKSQLRITTDSEEDVKSTYKKIIDGLPLVIERFNGFYNSLSAFNTITLKDRQVLAKRAYYDFWVLSNAEYMNDGDSMLFLYTGEVYSAATMRKILDKATMEMLFRFSDQFNALGLTDLEIAALCAVRLTIVGDSTLSDRPAVDRVRRHFENTFIYALKSEHPESHEHVLEGVNRLLPLLEETNRVQQNVIAKYPVNYNKL